MSKRREEARKNVSFISHGRIHFNHTCISETELPIMRHQFYGDKLQVKNHEDICSEKLFTFYQKMLIHEKGSYSLV